MTGNSRNNIINQLFTLLLCPAPPSPQIQLLEEVIPLVVDDDKGRKIFYFYLPDRFHAQVLEVDAVDFSDAVLGQARRVWLLARLLPADRFREFR